MHSDTYVLGVLAGNPPWGTKGDIIAIELTERQSLQSDIDDGHARLDAFQRIWADERDYDALVQAIDDLSTLLVQEVLAQLKDTGEAEVLQCPPE